MVRLEVRLVNDAGRAVGFGDRWATHRVKDDPDGPILGKKHVGITIACVNRSGKVLVAHRRHRIFDKVWTLAGDTHPYRIRGETTVESLVQAAKRCAMDDLGVTITGWSDAHVLSYAARDPRDPRYCENELLHLMVTWYDGPLHMNPKNAYQLRWVELGEILAVSEGDLSKRPINRKYAPWIHALCRLPKTKIQSSLLGRA